MDPSDVHGALVDVFGFASLRPGQSEVIRDVLAGSPVIGVMPTGAGKSLCYQLPAVLLGRHGGVSLVVSPLIALMKDQVDGLRARGVATAALTSAASASEQTEILDGLRAGCYDLVFVAPERFNSPRFVDALGTVAGQLALLAIDEAHCISEWGHEFRPAYRLLGDVVKRLRPPRIVALTATATPAVRDDIATQLGLNSRGAIHHVRGFSRPNLKFIVEPAGGTKDKAERLVQHVRSRSGGTAIVYAATRKNSEAHRDALKKAGLSARAYHAGLDDDERERTQDAFMAGRLDAIVATNAFGMGVDKADIRLVVHADLPRSPEAYYQESGRAGRDGDAADCVLLFNHGDVRLQEFLIDASHPSADVLRGVWRCIRDSGGVQGNLEELRDAIVGRPHVSVLRSATRILQKHGFLLAEGDALAATLPEHLEGEFPPLDPEQIARRAEVERSKLQSMVEYAYHAGCRHRYLLNYFGDFEAPQRACSACDNCLDPDAANALSEEQTETTRQLLALVDRLSSRFGRTRLAAIAVGTDDDDRLVELPERGCMSGRPRAEALDLLRTVEGAGLVRSTGGEYPTLAITSRGRQFVDGRLDSESLGVRYPIRRKAAVRRRGGKGRSRVVSDDAAIDNELAERLRSLRSSLAAERSVPAYVIFSNRTLDELASTRPTTLDDLSRVHGIGSSRLERFGDAILSVLTS